VLQRGTFGYNVRRDASDSSPGEVIGEVFDEGFTVLDFDELTVKVKVSRP